MVLKISGLTRGEGKRRNRPCFCGSGKKFKKCCLIKPQMPLKGSDKVSEKDKDAIAAIMDSISDEYLANHQVVFSSESERKKVHFTSLKAKSRDWERSQNCKYPGCTSMSIKRSHTIPRGALSLIAEDGHLFHPQFNQVSGRLEVSMIGINEASTFPGFCELHELWFQNFEANIQMQDSSDYALQTYRTVCREIAIKEHQLRHYKNTLEDFRRRREEWGRKRLEDAFRNKFRIDSEFEVKSFGIDVDDIVKELEKNLDQTEQDIKCFKNTFLTPFVNLDKSGRVSLTLFQHTLTERLPVALAGRGNFSILDSKGSSKRKDILAVINVLPTKKGTEIFICVSNEHKDALLVYISNFTGKEVDRKGVIRMVESWMLHGSDHWFLAPSAWLSLSVDQQTSVIEAIKDLNYNIGAQPAVPILDTTKNCP